jgi:hypothetical protein
MNAQIIDMRKYKQEKRAKVVAASPPLVLLPGLYFLILLFTILDIWRGVAAKTWCS